MTKTTIYLEENLLSGLKRLSVGKAPTSVAKLIREAVREFLTKNESKRPTSHLQKILKQKPRTSSFGDAVAYQRRLRSEWDKK